MIEFDYWGSPMKLFVADAKYRSTGLAYDGFSRSHGNPNISVKSGYFDGTADDRTEALPYTKDDAWIQSTYAVLKDDGTAKSNTDHLMGFSNTKAAHHCRNQDISGVGPLDLPNLYELIILYLESDNIDALDPTAEANKTKALGIMGDGGRFSFGGDYAWSSTKHDTGHAWGLGSRSRVYSLSLTGSHGVIPVKELDV